MRYKGILESIGNTPLVRLTTLSPVSGVNIHLKLEGVNPTGSVKDRVARSVIEQAETQGKLTRDKVILEPTSGNTGISLAMVGGLKGYGVEVVIPENVSPERTDMLRAYGAKVHYSPAEGGSNTAIKVAREMAERDGRYFMPFQYENQANPGAHYESTAVEIIRDLPDVDVFIAGLGTGGTLMGVGRRLREHNPGVKVIAAAPEDAIQGLRRLEDGYIPPILDLSMLDGRHLVRNESALERTKDLLIREGIFAGVSSGAVVECAIRVAEKMDRGNIVCLSADGGWKYLSTGLWGTDLDAFLKGTRKTVQW